ncbi:hypothetical protein NA8A_04723 [Nitratireductor indicus C115]|uniref:Uncharacterized protein n=1 Tax=Nitratireductor indicus C115 TaxID=1231190 RepID=K2P7U2_9HYPH|nr:hypothetical protein [Nitratireductor indicus]EKF43306.1 hypothetical protein NA8A_04723 [Nitratireductor indicus C115]SFQ10472.1 hypothetical protein SAMN05216176_101363 [Nitratireductor indicus]
MNERIFVPADDEDALADALSAKSPVVRCMARLNATGIVRTIETWAESEMARGTTRSQLISALADVQVQTFASLTAQLLPADTDRSMIEYYCEFARIRMQENMSATRLLLAEAAS